MAVKISRIAYMNFLIAWKQRRMSSTYVSVINLHRVDEIVKGYSIGLNGRIYHSKENFNKSPCVTLHPTFKKDKLGIN